MEARAPGVVLDAAVSLSTASSSARGFRARGRQEMVLHGPLLARGKKRKHGKSCDFLPGFNYTHNSGGSLFPNLAERLIRHHATGLFSTMPQMA